MGQIGTGTLSRDLEVWWAKVRGKPNPLLKIGQTDHGNQDGQTLWALKDVSFQVQQGEVLGIIGRNGAGKSTLLKILSRVTAPTSGQVKVKGRIASLLEVGTGFHPELTGRENIFLNGAILGMTKQEVQRKFDEIVNFAEIDKFVDTPVKRYSSGMYVRLAFAVAAHLESEILLVDEVLAVGDAEFQKKCLGKMGDVATNQGRTVFFVSHNMASIQNLCKTTIVMDKGQLIKKCDSQEAITLYLDTKRTLGKSMFATRNLDSKEKTYLTNVILKSGELQNINTLMSGQPLEIIIDYNDDLLGSNISISIGIYNSFGEKILHLGTEFVKPNKIKMISTGKQICYLPSVPLPKGKYYFNFALYKDGKQIDHAANAMEISIIDGDYYGSGKLPQSHEHKFLVDYEWFIT